MAVSIRRVQYFHTTVQDRPGEGYHVLSGLAEAGVNLLAFTAVPIGPESTQLTLFPEAAGRLEAAARACGLALTGPNHALLVQGDDRLGALADIHRRLSRAGVSVFASSGVTDGRGSYGCLLYVRPEQVDAAARALEV